MELNQLIGNALNELQLAREFESKKNYRIEELVIEVNISNVETVNGRLNLTIIEGGGNHTVSNSHKIVVKLKPAHGRNNVHVSVGS